MIAADEGVKCFTCCLVINKPQPKLHSEDTSIRGHLPWSRGCLLNRGSTVFLVLLRAWSTTALESRIVITE